MKPTSPLRLLARCIHLGVLALLASCASVPLPPGPGKPDTPPVQPPPPAPAQPPSPPAAPARPPVPDAVPRVSSATTALAYRRDAAAHVYAQNRHRIWQGRLPPNLYAIGVLQVDVGSQGEVRGLSWMRAPRHAPEVVSEIERTARAAAPYPLPARLGRVVYTDVWLWHRSGQFQLDTLTEGQDSAP